MYIEKGKLDRIIDPSLNGETTPHSLKYFAKLANNCLHTEPNKMPTMSEVVKSLEIALVLHERKGRSQGTIAKAFQGIKLVPKEKHELILVYDYMVNGTLKSRLHETHSDPLHWKKRLEICLDIARGLEYLHTNVEQQFVHCDITPSNVFLDDEWVAKIAAFEMSIPIPNSKATEGVETALCGTYAYLDPEYMCSSKVTKKTDVYAFGVVFVGTLSCLHYEEIRRPSRNDVLGSLQSSLKMQEAWEDSVEMGDELHMANVPRSYNNVVSVESKFTIGGQIYIISDLVPPWNAITTS
ncbi:hypothetical protein RHGRI_003950 [Rhododendron griersonianum]|uniref:Protein kinase domain-containing protein n=1 Tax=Rhododendron griersonianum TaxID=479676 RepID=A0AAV6L8M6_9ERIC|nr:hypothetical protein RHGRI_003950 [Rhododendron griersonianum]